MKHGFFFNAAFAVAYTTVVILTVGCSQKRRAITLSENTAENAACPAGLSATIHMHPNNLASVVAGNAVQFKVVPNGCLYQYDLYFSGQAQPVRFSGETFFSQTFTQPTPSAQVLATVVALDRNNRPAAQATVSSTSFSVASRPDPFSCEVEPRILSLEVPVNAQNQPLSNPPSFNLAVKFSGPGKVQAFNTPFTNYLALSANTAIPSSTFATQHTLLGTLQRLSSSSVVFEAVSQTGARATCAAQFNVVLQPNNGGQTGAQWNRSADFTGDGRLDVLTFDASTQKFWVAVGDASGVFTFREFGTRPGITISDAFAADWSGDNRADLLFRSPGGSWTLAVASSSATFNFFELGAWPSASPLLTGLATEDIDRDGRQELVGTYNGIKYVSYIRQSASDFSISAPIPIPPALSLTATPVSVAYNASTSLSWLATNVTSCLLYQDNSLLSLPAGANTSGSHTVNQLMRDTNFQLKCVQSGIGAMAESAVLTVRVAQPPGPQVTLFVKTEPSDSARDARVVPMLANNVWLKWITQNVASCGLFANGLQIISAVNSPYIARTESVETAYQLRCLSLTGGQVVSNSFTVKIAGEVQFSPATIDFGRVQFGQSSAPQVITLSNPQGRYEAYMIDLRLPAEFAFENINCVQPLVLFGLRGGDSCQFAIKFTPSRRSQEAQREVTESLQIKYKNDTERTPEQWQTNSGPQLKGVGFQ